jgi:hypothetical protein
MEVFMGRPAGWIQKLTERHNRWMPTERPFDLDRCVVAADFDPDIA